MLKNTLCIISRVSAQSVFQRWKDIKKKQLVNIVMYIFVSTRSWTHSWFS